MGDESSAPLRITLGGLSDDDRLPHSTYKDPPVAALGTTHTVKDLDLLYDQLNKMAEGRVMLKLRPARGPDFYAGIEVIFPGKDPIYFNLDVSKDPR